VRRLAPRGLGPALERAAHELAPQTTLARVQAVWEGAVGSTMAAEAEPVSERQGTVTVACRSAVWANELALLSPELVANLNAALEAPPGHPSVRALRFVASGPRRPR